MKSFCRTTCLICAAALGLSLITKADGQPWEGHFIWTNKGHEHDFGNVTQNVDLLIKSDGSNANIGVTISWRPGAAVEMGAIIPQAAISTQTDQNGNVSQLVTFQFTDGFHNTGTAQIVITGNTATLSLDATQIVESRAVRQYGDYSLTRQ